MGAFYKKKQKIVIIDTGCANINSVRFAINRLGYQVKISQEPNVILAADKLFLPGVGTANEAMGSLKQRHLIHLLSSITEPLLGICLGMQLFGLSSQEGKNDTPCLGYVPVKTNLLDTGKYPLPHMGWDQVRVQDNNPLFKGIANNSYFYFVHSYGMPINPYTIASTHYGQDFSAAIQCNHFFGVQFHPERSSNTGAKLIQNFLEI